MRLTVEEAGRSIARVCDAAGKTFGTAFVIGGTGPDLHLLTCHHVVDGRSELRLKLAGRDAVPCTIVRAIPEIDLAVLAVKAADERRPLPLVSSNAPAHGRRYWSEGYHHFRAGSAIRAAFPVEGTVSGTTSVKYRQYELEGVLVLRDDAFDEGLSGAPVLDPEWGVVFGVINAKFSKEPVSGFAIPLSHATVRDHLASELAVNEASVPRGGPYLNVCGALDWLRRQRERVVDRLVQTQRFLDKRYVEREIEETTVRMFLTESTPILPIIGVSGVGKTAVAVHVSSGIASSALLTREDVASSDVSLRDALARSLRAARAEVFVDSAVDLLGSVLSREKERLLLVVDGLNEIDTVLRNAMDGWVAQTLDWTRTHGARLIVTSRPEFWERAEAWFPTTSLFRVETRGASRVPTLSDFSSREVSAAEAAYGLKTRPPWARHPLFLRLFANTGGGSLLEVFERFVSTKLGEAAGLGRTRQALEAAVSRIAALLHHGASYQLAVPDFFTAAVDDSAADALLRVNLFVDSEQGSTIQPVFDELGDYLASLHVVTFGPKQLGRALSSGAVRPLHLGAMFFAALRHGRKKASVASAILRAAVEALDKSRDRAKDWLVTRLFAELATDADLALVKRFVWGDHRASSDLLHFFRTTRLSFQHRYDLLEPLIAAEEDYYVWEAHHEKDLLFELAPRSIERLIHVIDEDLERDADTTIRHLVQWLDRETKLKNPGPGVTIADVAGQLLWARRDRCFDILWHALAEVDGAGARRLHSRIACEEPERAVALMHPWARPGGDPRLTARAVVCLQAAAAAEPLDVGRAGQIAAPIRQLLAGQCSRATRSMLLLALARLTRAQPDALEDADIRELYEQSRLVHAYTMDELERIVLGQLHDGVAFLREQLLSDAHGEPAYAIKIMRSFRGGTLAQEEQVAALLEELFLKIAHPASDELAFVLENYLRYFDPAGAAYERLVRLAERVLREGPEEARVCVLYFATSAGLLAGPQAPASRHLLDLALHVPTVDYFFLFGLCARGCRVRAMQSILLRLAEPPTRERLESRVADMLSENDDRRALLTAEAEAAYVKLWIQRNRWFNELLGVLRTSGLDAMLAKVREQRFDGD